jgi:hypothetical protein
MIINKSCDFSQLSAEKSKKTFLDARAVARFASRSALPLAKFRRAQGAKLLPRPPKTKVTGLGTRDSRTYIQPPARPLP